MKTTTKNNESCHTVNPLLFNRKGQDSFFSGGKQKQGPFFGRGSLTHPFLQPRLNIGSPNDILEKEADRVADKIACKRDPIILGQEEKDKKIQKKEDPFINQVSKEKTIQEKPAFESPGVMDSADPGDTEEIRIQEKEINSSSQADSIGGKNADSVTESRLEQSRGRGEPLSEDTRSIMESAIGADFSDVHVHTSPDAVQMSRDLSAQAFTSGNDIYFNNGRYNPGTREGYNLLAHELTHTVQQGASKSNNNLVQSKKQVENHIQKQEKKTSPPGPELLTQKSPGLPTQNLTPVDISTGFKPNPATAAYLDENDNEYKDVPVTIKDLADGAIKIKQIKKAKDTTPAKYDIKARQGIPVKGIDFLYQISDKIVPVIVINASNPDNISGFLSFSVSNKILDNPNNLIGQINNYLEPLGISPLKVPALTNKVENGILTLNSGEFSTTVAGFLEAGGSFGIVGKNFVFTLITHVDIKGLAKGDFNIERKENGNFEGGGEIAVGIKNVSGKIKATYVAGDVTILGAVGIESEKFSGFVTVMVADKATAKKTMMAELGVETLEEEKKKEPSPKAADKKTKKNQVVIGWGTVTARITPWLTGTAKVGLDEIGQVTIVGKIEVPSEVQLMEQKGKKISLFELEIKAGYGIPLIGQVGLFASIGMFISAGFGPLVLRNVSFDGIYSTDPSVLQKFTITGTLSISAFAIIGLEARAGVFVTLIGHDIKAGIKVTAAAGIRAYAEVTPTFEYAEKASPEGGKIGEAWLKGHFEAAAQLFLKLAGSFFVEIDAPWWSPVPDKTWDYPLGDVEYPIGPSLGIGGDVAWLVGSPEVPELKFSPVEFDASKFTSDIMADPPPGKGGGKGGEQKGEGKWDDKAQKGGKDEKPEVKKDNKGLEGKKKEDTSKWPDEKRYMHALGKIGEMGDDSKKQGLTLSVLDTRLKKIKQQFNINHISTKDKKDGSIKVFVKHAKQDNNKNLVEIRLMSEAEKQKLVNAAKKELEVKQDGKVDPKTKTIKESDAKAIASEIAAKHKVLEEIKITEGKESWDYELDLGDKVDKIKGCTKSEKQVETKEHDENVNQGLDEITKQEKALSKDGGIKKNEAEKIAADVKSKFPVFKTITVIDGTDSWDYDYTASPGKVFKSKSEKEERIEEALLKLKNNFGKARFSPSEADDVLKDFISTTTRKTYINTWIEEGKIFIYGSSLQDPQRKFTFDASKKGKRNIPKASKRFIFGFSNPSHDSKTGIEVLGKGLEEEKSPDPFRKSDWDYMKNKAWFSSKRPGSIYVWNKNKDKSFRENVAILGHADPGASGYWNANMKDRDHNMSWNKNPSNYWGPEHKLESSESGSEAERYKDPDPNKADKMWWDPSDPRYPGNQPWGEGYDWDFKGLVKK